MTPTALPQGLPRARVAVVAAHPDDELVGAGALLPVLDAPLIVYVTDGAPRDGRDAHAAGFSDCAQYAAARRSEAEAALALAGIGTERMVALGAADQEASFGLAALARPLAITLYAHGIETVITHAYEGGHPDHDAAAFAAHAALRLMARSGHPPPHLLEMTGYHADGEDVVAGRFIAHPGAGAEIEHAPAAPLRRLKERMIDCHVTQRAVLAPFRTIDERYRAAPSYDFTVPPHSGRLHYERHAWGVTGERWRGLAAAAASELGLCR